MIVVVTRTFNESKNVERFVHGYDFADYILVSEGGSTDDTVEKLGRYKRVVIYDSPYKTVINEHHWNPDNPNINFILNKGLELSPDWIILDDFDDVPNACLRKDAKIILEDCSQPQINAFRIYMWGDKQYFPKMNNYFDPIYTSLWAWKPKFVNIHANEKELHGTIIGLSDNVLGLDIPYCLLHKSWDVDTIDAKIKKYNNIGLPMEHPFSFAGPLMDLEYWMKE